MPRTQDQIISQRGGHFWTTYIKLLAVDALTAGAIAVCKVTTLYKSMTCARPQQWRGKEEKRHSNDQNPVSS